MSDASSSAGRPLAPPDAGPTEDPRQLGLFSGPSCNLCGCSPEKPCGERDTIGAGSVCSFCRTKGAKR